MITYHEYNLAPNIIELEKIGSFINVEITDDQVWEQAREFENIPVFENIYQSILLEQISDYLSQQGFENQVWINARDTSISINSDGWESLSSLDEFKSIINY